jgi:hypothetical protein
MHRAFTKLRATEEYLSFSPFRLLSALACGALSFIFAVPHPSDINSPAFTHPYIGIGSSLPLLLPLLLGNRRKSQFHSYSIPLLFLLLLPLSFLPWASASSVFLRSGRNGIRDRQLREEESWPTIILNRVTYSCSSNTATQIARCCNGKLPTYFWAISHENVLDSTDALSTRVRARCERERECASEKRQQKVISETNKAPDATGPNAQQGSWKSNVTRPFSKW